MVLRNKTIIFLGNTVTDGPIKSTSLFVARHLANFNKVYFIDYPITFKDLLKSVTKDRFKRIFHSTASVSGRVTHTDIPNFSIITTPPVLPINFISEGPLYRFLLSINEKIICSFLNKVLRKERNDHVIYINSFNFHYPNISKFIEPDLSIYHCVDPLIVPYDMKHGITSEKQLVVDSDLVICTSKALYEEKILMNPNTYFVPNGTELSGLETNFKLHSKLLNIKKPIIGYLGTIERRIDYELLESVIKKNPEKSFVFAGPIDKIHVPEIFFNLENVYLIGPIKYSEVPQLINGFDLAIIPFKKDGVSNTIFPIKLFEYLSMGKPVVLTNFNSDLQDYTANLVRYCENAEEFNVAIDESLTTNSDSEIFKRKAIAKNNTWEERSIQISKIIFSHLSKTT